jgi:hypothetical protein
MKEDYLWDKTGEDAEIQGLENALKAFRYRETAPPALPQKVFTLDKAKPRKFFQTFGFGFAALAAVVAVFSVVWFQIAGSQIPVGETVAEKSEPRIENPPAEEKFAAAPRLTPVVKPENPPPSARRGDIKIRQRSAPIIRPEKAVLRNTVSKEPAETLTAEEKYAYDQLMLALSITGSKLRIVQDKIKGIEEQNAVIETAK